MILWWFVVVRFNVLEKFVVDVLGVLDEYSSSSSRTLCFDPKMQREKWKILFVLIFWKV